MKLEFNIGGVWEFNEFEIETDYKVTTKDNYDTPCPHCHSIESTTENPTGKYEYTMRSWIVPRVVIASNEGGHNTTGICLDCIIEAEKTLK